MCRLTSWAIGNCILICLGFALVGAAAAEAFILLADRIGRDALTGIQAVESPLYLASTAALALVGLVVLGEAWRRRHLALALIASVLGLTTLMMGVGHYHPENIQAYAIPGGIYTLVVAILLRRVRKALPVEFQRVGLASTRCAVTAIVSTTVS